MPVVSKSSEARGDAVPAVVVAARRWLGLAVGEQLADGNRHGHTTGDAG